ncbi:MAG: hypothetical protein M0R77_00620 [Gammaproteobacteria bacterium]|nr:hypothetical protein [Acholeplasmataceae bacterium]MCK9529057.1 hypothetical protein [Gammaproteobacteria bacterium]
MSKELLIKTVDGGDRIKVPYMYHGQVGGLMTNASLVNHFGLSGGTSLNSSSWLSFTLDDKQLYIPSSNVYQSVTWNALNSRGLIHGVEIEIAGVKYICRAIRVSDETHSLPSYVNAMKLEPNHSEFCRLFLPILSASVYNGWGYTYTGPKYANLAANSVNAREQSFWCREVNANNENQAFIIGYGWSTPSITDIRPYDKASATNVINSGGAYTLYRCWRPVFERVD